MSETQSDSHTTIDQLISEGKHAEAAAALRALGEPARAAQIYAKIWDFRAAADCARAAGDDILALKHLADSRDGVATAAFAKEIAARGPDEARAAASALSSKRMFDVAGEIREAAGDLEAAASLYQRAERMIDAARVLEALGRPRDAGRLLEKAITHGNASASAHLALGQLLARLGQHEDAARHLQAAAKSEETRAAALAALVPELAALGLPDAADVSLAAARAADPSLPPTVGENVARRPRTASLSGEEMAGGRYRLARLIGSGASGRVYQARDEVTGDEVAVKILAALDTDHDAFRRFVREASLGATHRHPNVVATLDFRADLGFAVMELCSHGTLADKLSTPLSPTTVRRVGLDLAAALAHAHAHGVIHRDVKPANVFFDGRGGAKLGDFGVAHLAALGPTQTGALIGTLAYMSPEQVTGAPITAAADLYSLGITLFQALTGRLPFLGPDFIAQHLGDAPPAPSEVNPKLGVAWDGLIASLLAKDPAARPASAAVVGEAIALVDAAAPPVLSLRRAASVPRAASAPPAAPEVPAPATTRLSAEVELGRTSISTLARAVDGALERTVVLERFDEGHPDEKTLARLFALAGAASPHLQRVLDWNPTTRTVIFEAPAGDSLATRPALSSRLACRLLAQIATALAALHDAGAAHGQIDRAHILVDDDGSATLLAAGLPAAGTATPADDLAAIATLAVVPHVLQLPSMKSAAELRRWAEAEELRLILTTPSSS